MRGIITFATLALLTATALPPSDAITCPGDSTPDFSDTCYHEYILYDVDAAEVDVLVLPSASPYALRDFTTVKDAVQTWDNGINSLGPAWLGSGLNIHVYNVGLDPVPASALWDPEIVVVPEEYDPVLLFGIGEQVPASWCHGISLPGMDVGAEGIPLDRLDDLATLPAFHHHEGSSWGSLSARCASGGRMCFALNTNFLWLPDADNNRDMADLVAHEFGHCLGVGHVGDALDFTANRYPQDDIMSYENDGHDAGHRLCVSTLNILALQQVYGYLLGQAGYASSVAGRYVHQDPALWSSATPCAEPFPSYLDLTPVLNADPTGGL